jgi:hypothetical protein
MELSFTCLLALSAWHCQVRHSQACNMLGDALLCSTTKETSLGRWGTAL